MSRKCSTRQGSRFILIGKNMYLYTSRLRLQLVMEYIDMKCESFWCHLPSSSTESIGIYYRLWLCSLINLQNELQWLWDALVSLNTDHGCSSCRELSTLDCLKFYYSCLFSKIHLELKCSLWILQFYHSHLSMWNKTESGLVFRK